MKTLRVALIGCVDSSLVALESLLALAPAAQVVGVITRRGSTYNADFADLAPLAREHGVPLLFVEDVRTDEQQAAWLLERAPDLVFCVGWSRLLGPELLAVAPMGVVGFHPAALPANRGRHPIVWALALGLKSTASSFFLMDEGPDGGPLLSQEPIDIDDDDDAAALYGKILSAMPAQLGAIVRGLRDGSLVPLPQDEARANYWRKRGADDGRIDWRMGAQDICNLVRALARPYPGAHFVAGGQDIKVWKCEVVPEPARNLEPGKVLAVRGRELLVKSGRDAVLLTEHELAQLPGQGDYL